MKMCRSKAFLLAVMVAMPFSGMADDTNAIPLVYSVENTGTNCAAPPLPGLGHLPLVQPLPDPFMRADWSGRSTNFADWECRRAEIKAQIEHYEIGTKPAVDPTNIFASYSGGILTVRVTNTVSGIPRTLTLTCAVSLPSGSGPFPAVVGMNSPNGSIPSSLFTSRNIARITYLHNQVTVYGSQQNTDPYYQLYGPALDSNNTGQYSAWAWGVSRIIDGLEMVTNSLPIDTKHLCVTGCSYAGKMALFAGALDERIALTIAQESGGGGATSWRYSHTEPPGSVECIENTDYNWFSSSMSQFGGNNVSYLPEDHHELMAMCAPRALFVTSNPGWVWLSNPSCYVCSRACQQIYQTLGIPDRFGFSHLGGHTHCEFPDAQSPEVGAFLDKFLLGDTNANTTVGDYPVEYASIDYARWYAWWGTPNPVFPETSLSLSMPASATEGDGTLAGQGTVMVLPPTNDLVVNLTSSDPSQVTVPASVVIPAGQSSAVFDLTIIDDSLLDGDQTATITASVLNYNNAQAKLTVHDNETAALSVTLPASVLESAGTLFDAGTVSIGTAAGADVTVSLTSSDTSRLVVPPSTTIPAGQTSATFYLSPVNNNLIEGQQTAGVTAHVANWTDGSASMAILDDDLPDHFAWSAVPSPQSIGEPFPVTITAQDAASNTLDFRLPVSLSALLVGNAAGTNTILDSPSPEQSATDGIEYVMGYSFTPSTNLKVTHVRHCFGDNVTIWTDSGRLLVSQNVVSVPGTWVDTPLPAPIVLPAGVTYRIMIHENGVEYFWSQDLPVTFPDGTINQSWWDYGDIFPTQGDGNHWYFVDLRYATDIASVPVSPGATPNFSSGVWSGNLAVLQAATNVLLQASAGAGHTGLSVPFDVLGTPKLAIAASSNTVVLSWPAAASDFNLEQASTPPDWSASPLTPILVGDRYLVTNILGSDRMYFRLRKP